MLHEFCVDCQACGEELHRTERLIAQVEGSERRLLRELQDDVDVELISDAVHGAEALEVPPNFASGDSQRVDLKRN